MGQRLNAIDQSRSVMLASLFRKIFTLVEGLTAVGGVMGSLTLIAGTGTPPVSVLRSVGLTSWVLPGLWLFPTPAAPSAAAAVLASRKSKWAPPLCCWPAPHSPSSFWCRFRSLVRVGTCRQFGCGGDQHDRPRAASETCRLVVGETLAGLRRGR